MVENIPNLTKDKRKDSQSSVNPKKLSSKKTMSKHHGLMKLKTFNLESSQRKVTHTEQQQCE